MYVDSGVKHIILLLLKIKYTNSIIVLLEF
jgi:hypothetical protein